MAEPKLNFIPLQINLDGDNAWPELKDTEFSSGIMTHIAALPGGMTSGKTSIAIRGKLEDGTEVVLETSWALLLSATKAIGARYNE